MKYLPASLTRYIGSTSLKFKGATPTMLVVGGVVGFGVTAVMAARATRDLEPVMDRHRKGRLTLESSVFETKRDRQREITQLYAQTTGELVRVYGATVVVGSISAVAILGGHRILRRRHLATVAAYTGLIEQFQTYRERVAKTLGPDIERGIYEGAHGEWVEDPDHKGEHKLMPVFAGNDPDSYLRPWFDEYNPVWRDDAMCNYLYLKNIQEHQNHLLQIRGHVFLNDVYDALKIPRTQEGQQAGWKWKSEIGDNHVDFGFMNSIDPETIAFREGRSTKVRLNFNIDGPITI